MTATNNRTLHISARELKALRSRLWQITHLQSAGEIANSIICQDMHVVLPLLPHGFVDLLILDPPYNLTKSYRGQIFRARDIEDYGAWVNSWLSLLPQLMKRTGSVYFCADWRMGAVVSSLLERYFTIRNRITWEREKGRGAARNWKNCAEDIWFATVSNDYTFNADAVKLKRRVMAPYRDDGGQPKDWRTDRDGQHRLTAPSNLWTDITVPFWSMPENTEHPTQKPEKLLAKLILASTQENDVVFDPFLGSGTSVVVAKKLNRKFVGIEIDEQYCSLALKRLEMAKSDRLIQGYVDGVFWERNSLAQRSSKRARNNGRG